MKYLEEFVKDKSASYDDLVKELFELEESGLNEILSLITLHSSLGRLENLDDLVQNAIHQYDNLEKWRDEVGEIT